MVHVNYPIKIISLVGSGVNTLLIMKVCWEFTIFVTCLWNMLCSFALHYHFQPEMPPPMVEHAQHSSWPTTVSPSAADWGPEYHLHVILNLFHTQHWYEGEGDFSGERAGLFLTPFDNWELWICNAIAKHSTNQLHAWILACKPIQFFLLTSALALSGMHHYLPGNM